MVFLLNRPLFQILLVFPKYDAVAEAAVSAASKLGYDRTVEHTADDALSAYDRLGHDIAVLDLRHPKLLDGIDLCKYVLGQRDTIQLAID